MTDSPTLSPVEARLVAAIVADSAATQAELGVALKITSRYVRKLLARPHVRGALDAAARESLRETSSTLARGAARAARSLIRMATGSDRASPAKVAAARAVVALAVRLDEHDQIETRLAAIEAAIAAQKPQGGPAWQ